MNATATVTKTTVRMHHPCILSCGYKSIYISKSGLEFAAWLVCFEATGDEPNNNNINHEPPEEENVGVVSATVAAQRQRPCKRRQRQKNKQCFYWRSKRDFWRLGRATAALSSSSSSSSSNKATPLLLPKAAWKKLSNEAPWKRPDYNEDYYCDDAIDDIQKNDEHKEDANASRRQNAGGWKRHMYKSLRLLDQYLQQVQSICNDISKDCCSSNIGSIDIATIRHDCSMQSSDQPQPQPQPQPQQQQQQQQCKVCAVRVAWREFCRSCDTDNLMDQAAATGAASNSPISTRPIVTHHYATATTAATAAASTTSISTAMTGNALGQYFCHPANAQQLVRVCLEKIQQQLLLQQTTTTTTTTQFLFIEPSCGHGQVLGALLDELDLRQSLLASSLTTTTTTTTTESAHRLLQQLDLKQCSFVGMDIDPAAIAHCRDRFSQRYHDYHCSDDDDDSNNNIQPDINWMTVNFLLSQRASVMDTRLQVDGTRRTSSETDDNNNMMVIVLGGPPYSSGAGHGGNGKSNTDSDNNNSDKNGTDDGMQHDLPMRFVQHAIQEWGASVVTFLMPERCGRNDDNKSWLYMNRDFSTIQSNDRSNTEGCYALANFPLEAPSVFYFQGLTSAPVKQPSIIQCFWRERAE
jgi:hypothetical protein